MTNQKPNKVIIYDPRANYPRIAQELVQAGHGPDHMFIPSGVDSRFAANVAASMHRQFHALGREVECHEMDFPYTDRTVPFYAERIRLHWRHDTHWSGTILVVCDHLADLMAQQFTQASDHVIQKGTAVVLEQNASTHANPQAFHLVNAYQ